MTGVIASKGTAPQDAAVESVGIVVPAVVAPAVTELPPPPPPPPPVLAPKRAARPAAIYAIQVGAFSTRESADQVRERFSAFQPEVAELKGRSGGLFAVRFGAFEKRAEANRALAEFQTSQGVSAILVRP